MSKSIYKGFSPKNWIKNKTFSLTNIELVKEDLMYHIWTILNTRVMMPGFGTRIPLLAFEPCDDQTINIVREDLTTVFNYDPRVELLSLQVLGFPNNNAIVGIANLRYKEFNVTEELRIDVPTQ